MQGITQMLWFDGRAEEAANFYVGVFEDARIVGKMLAPEGIPNTAAGSVLTVEFEIAGQHYTALNGGPQAKFNESVSFVVRCDSQEEVDRYWAALTADGGAPVQCGWLTDKFGLAWQVWPPDMEEMMTDPNGAKVAAVMAVVMKSVKLDGDEIRRAFDAA